MTDKLRIARSNDQIAIGFTDCDGDIEGRLLYAHGFTEYFSESYLEEKDIISELPPEEVEVILEFIKDRLDFHEKGGK